MGRIDKAVSTFSRNELFFSKGLDNPNHAEAAREFRFLAQVASSASCSESLHRHHPSAAIIPMLGTGIPDLLSFSRR
jgi:hypothetical protein